MKNQFSVVSDEYTLVVTEFEGSRPYRGVCKELDFDWGGFCVLDGLVEKFLEKINEKKLQPEIIEYRGYELTIKRTQLNNAWFVGTSSFNKDWRVESATKQVIVKAFEEDVDELITKRGFGLLYREATKIYSY